jgi:glycerol-3-phosphate dehydrogenase
MSTGGPYDLLVIGGGINGAGIARDGAGRGLKVLLVERDDLASGTSSASSKLVHGGLRYLEQYQFRLVRESLAEREVLLSIAPHLVRPLTFVLPHAPGLRPAWMIRAGLFLYDHLATRSVLAGSRALDLRRDAAGQPLKPGITRGFSYSDCWVDDSRLVVLNALDAAERGASIRTRCRFVAAQPDADCWTATLQPEGQGPEVVRARILVNAAGPWVEEVLHEGFGRQGPRKLRLVKGSHIVVPRRQPGEQAYILQNPDRRIVFVIPFEQDFTLIGTTDEFFEGDARGVTISDDEVHYLCEAASRFLRNPVLPDDVVWSFSGVRPLYDDAAANPSTMTRDYAFDLTTGEGRPPLLSVFGGKLTTYRRLAEHALSKLQPFLPGSARPWTRHAPLPGGDLHKSDLHKSDLLNRGLQHVDFDRFFSGLRARWPWLPAELARRLGGAYGTRVETLIGDAKGLDDLGPDLGAGLTEREVDYLVGHEWARTVDDILWRRSKLGLHGGPDLAAKLAAYLR